ncbi:DsbA family protein [Patescibacteria group bacterium]
MSSFSPKSLIIPVVVVVAIVGVLALAVYFSSGEEDTTAQMSDKLVYDNALAEPLNDDDWVKGAEEPRVTIVNYSDFQCPACGYAHEKIINRLLEEHPDDLRIVFRHFPLPSHKLAHQAAQATEAAGSQGKFWEMTDLIFTNQSSLATESFEGFARELGLDMEKFLKDLAEETYQEYVDADKDGGERSGVDATPSFYINGEKYEGKISYDDLKAEVEKRLP